MLQMTDTFENPDRNRRERVGFFAALDDGDARARVREDERGGAGAGDRDVYAYAAIRGVAAQFVADDFPNGSRGPTPARQRARDFFAAPGAPPPPPFAAGAAPARIYKRTSLKEPLAAGGVDRPALVAAPFLARGEFAGDPGRPNGPRRPPRRWATKTSGHY